jgi:hypothetical protein
VQISNLSGEAKDLAFNIQEADEDGCCPINAVRKGFLTARENPEADAGRLRPGDSQR